MVQKYIAWFFWAYGVRSIQKRSSTCVLVLAKYSSHVDGIATHIDPATIVEIQSASPRSFDLSPLHNPLHGTLSSACGLFGHSEDVVMSEVFSDVILDLRCLQMGDRNDEQIVKTLVFIGKNADAGSLGL